MKTTFAEIILPLPLAGTFTYEVTAEQLPFLKIGQRVAVQFGKRKIYTGIIHSLHQQAPELYKTKPIYHLLDKEALVKPAQIKFWQWVADYYMCSLGEVYKNVFPSALKLDSDTFIRPVEGKELSPEIELSDEAYTLWEALLHRNLISVNEAADILEKKSAIPVAKELMDLGLVQLDEKLIKKYTPKIDYYVALAVDLNKVDLEKVLEKVQRSPKQREIFLHLVMHEKQSAQPLKLSELVKKADCSHAQVRALEKKDLISIYENQTQRVKEHQDKTEEIKQLSEAQNTAYQSIVQEFKNKDTVLLHGVTSSGKTEIYIQLIKHVLKQKKTVLYLLPEIALTTQLTSRIQKHFGKDVGVYHSKFNQNERVELWQKTFNNDYKIIIGARSSLFLPLSNLGLIIVDEEHESSLKQNDSKPFYNARDASLVWAKMQKAKVLLGSATPSMEMYHLAQTKKIGYVTLNQRYGNIQMPEMEIIDLKRAYKRKEMTGNISRRLENQIRDTFKADKQVIIFQNRRGFAPILECETCGHTPFCPNCDTALTYHKISHTLKCHYCGHSQAKPTRCYNCKSTDLKTVGLGTEQIEDELAVLFPDRQIARMDVDSMRKKFAFEKLITAFQSKEVDMIVGTQMLTKGLDFEDVKLVGIIRADSLLNFPDFRAHERAFQRIVQVAGRAGRHHERGKVFIQAFNAEHQILQYATTFDYEKMAKDILYERQNFLYPPFTRIIQIGFRHKNRDLAHKTALYYTQMLRHFFDEKTLLGPEAPYVSKLKNQYIFYSLVKISAQQSPKKIKKLLLEALAKLHQVQRFRAVRIDFDVDPY